MWSSQIFHLHFLFKSFWQQLIFTISERKRARIIKNTIDRRVGTVGACCLVRLFIFNAFGLWWCHIPRDICWYLMLLENIWALKEEFYVLKSVYWRKRVKGLGSKICNRKVDYIFVVHDLNTNAFCF